MLCAKLEIPEGVPASAATLSQPQPRTTEPQNDPCLQEIGKEHQGKSITDGQVGSLDSR